MNTWKTDTCHGLAGGFVSHQSSCYVLHNVIYVKRVSCSLANKMRILCGLPKSPSRGYNGSFKSLLLSPLPTLLPYPSLLQHLPLSVGVKSAYSPAPSTVYNQPPPQRQVTTLKPLAPSSSVSTSYNIYPAATSVQQPPTPISSYTLGSSFSSTVSATSYSGNVRQEKRRG